MAAGASRAEARGPDSDPLALDFLFRPRSVAVVGVSPPERLERGTFAGVSLAFLTALVEMGFPELYPVNPKYGEILGRRCYASVLDIPGPVDHVISCVPAHAVLGLVEDCIAKGVRSIHFFTAGFGETGEEERAELERRVVARAREAGIRVLGPNCMGLYVPASRLSFSPEFPRESGPISFISQSGGHATDLVQAAASRGVRFAKVVSYGNASDIDESELLSYLAHDPETRVICAYIEGVKDGRRFLAAMREAAARKPVVVLKGGRTAVGGRATLSHTGSLAGSMQVFDALLRQVGAIRVDSVEEMADACVAFQFLGVPDGPRVAVVGAGGGFSVYAADELTEAGLELPELPSETQEALRRFVPLAGTSVRNPVDTVTVFGEQLLYDTLSTVASASNIDVVLLQLGFGLGRAQRDLPGAPSDEQWARELASAVARARETTGKPIGVVARTFPKRDVNERLLALVEACIDRHVPLFLSLPGLARVIAKIVRWRRWHEVEG